MDCNAGAAVGQSFMQMGAVRGGMFGPTSDMHEGDHFMETDGHMMSNEGPMAMAGPNTGDWSSEFHQHHHHPMMHHLHAHHDAAMMEEAFHDASLHHQQPPPLEAAADDATLEDAYHGDDWLGQFHHASEGEQWAHDYNDEGVQVFTVEGEVLRTVEEKTRDSQFHAFMTKVRNREVIIDEVKGEIVPGPGPSSQAEGWASEFAQPGLHAGGDWAAEHATAHDVDMEQAWNEHEAAEDAAMREAWGSDDGDAMYDEFANNHFSTGEEGDDEWLKEYEQMQKQFHNAQESTDYPFEPNNAYLYHDDPYLEGIELQQAGNLAEAVLAYEAACQKDMSRQEAWKTLGVTQAENEKDGLAIRALNKARELNPKDVEVLAALSVSHTNESNHAQALRALREWLLAHPAYEALGSVSLRDDAAPAPQEDDFVNQFLFVSPSEHRDCETLFNAAIQLNPNDAELHSSLGVLKNLSHEYDEAASHFRNALQLRPTDPKLWNKLGATLANGNQSREALGAYDKALDINPGYVRAHFNLGIAHSNLGEHYLAAKQLLRAIVLQQGGVHSADGDGGRGGRSTREMWDVLRMTLNLMDRSDLVDLTWKQDVLPFLPEFGLEDCD